MKLNNKIENILKKYSDNTSLRAMVNVLPYIGGTLDVLLSSKIQKKSQERFLIFLKKIENQLNNIDKNKLNYSYLESEEFYDLFLETTRLVVRTRLDEKIEAYASILTSSVISDYTNNTKAEDILNIVEGLTENDINFIKLISTYLESEDVRKVNSDKIFNSDSLYKVTNKYNKETIFIGLLRLIKSSLLIKHPVVSTHKTNKLSFTITPLFNVVKSFIIS